MSTLILYPHLGKTFGSSGSPMHTEAEKGFLTDFARLMGEDLIDRLIALFGGTVSPDHIGAGREYYDGRFQVLGFYFLGLEQHQKNLNKLLAYLKDGNETAAESQKSFYRWYNYVHHSPSEFMRDTYKKIFFNNELIRGTLQIEGKKISIRGLSGVRTHLGPGRGRRMILYPLSRRRVTWVWSILRPLLQAIGHMDLIDSVPDEGQTDVGLRRGLYGSLPVR